jgi:hypothetical protein
MNKIEEFWYCVAPQDDIPLPDDTRSEQQESFNELISLLSKYKVIHDTNPALTTQQIVKNIILTKPDSISTFRKLIDISDKRLYLDLTYVINYYDEEIRLVETDRESLVKHSTAYFINYLQRNTNKEILADVVSKYFCDRGLSDSIEAFSSLTEEQLSSIFNNLIINRETLHRDAKLRGHGVEQAFAKIFKECGVIIYPTNKAEAPMAEHDPNVDLSTMEIITRNAKDDNCHSFDLIIKSTDNKIRVLIQSLIHTSDPGQYGVNKSDETINIYRRICAYNNNLNPNNKVYLLGSVDGVGFSENPNGTIVKMLDAFDDFFQMHTLFKIPIFLQKIGMINNIKGISFNKDYFDDYAIDHFVSTYLTPAGVLNMTGQNLNGLKTIEAGKAIVIFK